MSQQAEELTARHVFEIDTLNLEIKSLKKTTDEIIYLKDKEIEKLTAAALKRPNDYTLWWATGGFAAGIITTVSIFFLVK